MEDDASLHDASVERERGRGILVLIRVRVRDISIRSVFLTSRLRDSARPLEHVTLLVDPSVGNIFDAKRQEKTCHQDGARGGFVLDALQAVVVEEERGVCKELYLVSMGYGQYKYADELTWTIAVEITTPVPNWRIATMTIPSMLTEVNLSVMIGANTPMALVTRMTKSNPIRNGTS